MGATPRSRKAGVVIAAIAGLAGLAIACAAMAALATNVVGGAPLALGGPVADIPPRYLAAYRAAAVRFELGADGWSYLAAIGKVESDHGRSTAPGVSRGQNAHGCCAGPMQIHNGFGSGGGTWAAYATDGDGDGRPNIYVPEDAIATAGAYLTASGAPADWRAALFAYNRAGWYVDRVEAQAADYRRRATPATVSDSPHGAWLAPVPGFPGERCDARIVPDVVALVRTHGLRLTDCYGGAPHAIGGEHPLGLAVDAVPADGDWRRTERLARAAGWTPACAAIGCGGRGPFRQILYNGFPGHGDPRFSRTPHLHLSWQHAPTEPFSRAPWVRTLLTPASARPR